MKSTDLTIGDWVMAMLATPEPMKMEYIDNGDWLAFLEPIPLTPEILEANGFIYEKDYGSYYRSRWGEIDSDHYVTIGWNSKGEVYQYEVVTTMEDGFRSKKSAYGNTAIAVHSLQHALRLCGLDDLADNFKLA